MKKEPLLFHIMLKQGLEWFTLALENIKLNRHYIWDTLEMDWKEVTNF